MQQDVQQKRFVYRPPWMAGGTTTGHSNGSTYAAFLTPGGLEHRRSAATPTLEAMKVSICSFLPCSYISPDQPDENGSGGLSKAESHEKRNQFFLQDNDVAGDTDTLVLSKPSGVVDREEQIQQGSKQGKEQDTVIIQAKSRAAGSLADQYNRTFTSTSTGSGESTAPLRMSTPRTGAESGKPLVLTRHDCS